MAVGTSIRTSFLISIKATTMPIRLSLISSVASIPPCFKVLTADRGLIVINLAVTIKSFAIIKLFGVQPVAPVEFE
jgi:hypothetical protein